MKTNGHEKGPKRMWADWRARRDKSIAKPRRSKAAQRLEKMNRKHREQSA